MDSLCIHSIAAAQDNRQHNARHDRADSGKRVNECASEQQIRWYSPPYESSSSLRRDKLGTFHL